MVIEHLRKVALPPGGGELTDGQLLCRFIEARDQWAFESLVRRHGPMVLGVCRRLVGHAQDAEDAFQAAFLVLARRAASVVPHEAVGSWLYGVAYRTALKARALSSRRRAKEKQVRAMPEPQPIREDPREELLPLLDHELSRLPDKYRLAVVLCDLEGRSRKEVAWHLQIPEGTLSSRLTTARRILARRLRPAGLAVSAGAATVTVPGELIASTVQAAILFTMPRAALASSGAVALAEGVLRSMFLSKLKIVTVLLLAVFGLAAVAGRPAYDVLAGETAAQDTQKRQSAQAAKHAHNQERVTGSGKVVTKEMQFADFTAVDVTSVFHVEISRADAFRTAITADDNVLPLIKVTKDGTTLRIALDSKNKSISTTTALKATIAMPALEQVRVAHAGQVTFTGFKSTKGFKAKVTHASRLEGDIEAARVDLDVAEASTVTLKGAAKDGRLAAAGASRLQMEGFRLDRADVTLRDASSASIDVREKLDYDLTSASQLKYRGDPALGKHSATGASRASRASDQPGKKGAGTTLTFPHDPAAFQDHLRAMHDHLRAIHVNMGLPHGLQLSGPHHHTDSAAPARLKVGDKVPDLTLRGLDGKAVRLRELQKDSQRTKSGVVVLSFWCSFCPSCRRVEPALEKLAKDYAGKALVMALDASAGETAEQVNAAARKAGLTVPIVLDPDGRTADLFGTEATTTTVVIDGAGLLRYCGRFHNGDRTYVEDAVNAVLAGRDVAVPTTPHDGCRIVRWMTR
jgi:RNA polymerase sigma factor (sigma-70 family)